MTDKTIPRVAAEKPRGLIDRFGDIAATEQRIVAAAGAVYEQWGFERLDTPAFEYTEALGKFLPDLDRPNEGVFSFQDEERWLSLRYDLTAPLARFAAENFETLPKPYRRWAAGPVWRNEKPGPGRFREFWQCDADTVGSASPAADAEMIAVACAALESVGVKRGEYRICVSDRRLLDGLLEAIAASDSAQRGRVMRGIDKWDRLGEAGVRLLLGKGRKDESGDFTQGAGLNEAQINDVISFIKPAAGAIGVKASVESLAVLALARTQIGAEGVQSLREICQMLATYGLGEDQFKIDTSIVRGLEYYTGAVFEAQFVNASGVSFGSIGGGGRYDGLVSRFRGEPVPATGFSIGVSRLAAALEARGEGATMLGPVVVLAMDKTRMGDYLALARDLRAAGVRAEVYLGAAGMKAQLKYADKRGAPVAVIQGGDELARGTVTLKDLRLGAQVAAGLGEDREAYAQARQQVQQEVAVGEMAAAVAKMLARR
jgi:histidyl-tRNA synthetase